MQRELNFAHIEYSIQTKSIDIFTIGCNGHCVGCCNPEIKDWNISGFKAPQIISKVLKLITKFDIMIDRIILVGGDPVDAYNKYPSQFTHFLTSLRTMKKPIFLFTRHNIEKVDLALLNLIDYIKVGAYIPELTCSDNIQYGIKLATSNQKIVKVSDYLGDKNGDN